MKPHHLSALFCLPLIACGGGGGSSDNSPIPVPPPSRSTPTITLGLSDAPVDDADEVVITIESVTFKLNDDSSQDIVFDTFSNESEGIIDAETITIDLLKFQGSAQFNILEDEELPADDYQNVILHVLDEDIELSYVLEKDGNKKSIKVPSDNLKLGGVTINENMDNSQFTVEFNLRKSMTYKPGPQEYNLKPRGVRIVDNTDTGTLSGQVDVDIINQNIECMADMHTVYLYEGENLNSADLTDMVDEESNHGAPETAIFPFDATSPKFDNDSNSYVYEFGFIPVGTYTIAYACNVENDDPDEWDDITIPAPSDQVTTATVESMATTQVNFPLN